MEIWTVFDCTFDAFVDQKNPDQKAAYAFADVDVYPDADSPGHTTVCRVFLMDNKNPDGPEYLVDWHQDKYRANPYALAAVEKAKKKLKPYKDKMWREASYDTV